MHSELHKFLQKIFWILNDVNKQNIFRFLCLFGDEVTNKLQVHVKIFRVFVSWKNRLLRIAQSLANRTLNHIIIKSNQPSSICLLKVSIGFRSSVGC